MNEYVRYENMRYEMAECAEVVRRALGLTVPVSIKDLMSAMDKIGIQCVSDIPILKSGFFQKTTQTTRFRLHTMQKSTKEI